MANNFIPWLGSTATTSPQQANYGTVAVKGFEAGGFVKAEDFNAALRMTTLVCAGIASVFGFDTNTIDVSEETITKAIQGAKITMGEITASKLISPYISTYSLSATEIEASERISGQSLTILNVERISAGGTITGTEYKIDNNTVIDNNKNISGASLTIGNNVATISAAGDISGTSYTAGNLKVIDKDGNISGESVTAKKITSTGTVTANSLDINGRGISSQGVIKGDSLVVNSLETIDSSRNIKNVGSITASDDITTNSNISGNNVTATGNLTGNNITASGSITGNSLNINNGSGTIDSDGTINGTSYKINNTEVIDSSRNINAQNITASDVLKGNSLTVNKTERISSSGIVRPKCINFFEVNNIATLKDLNRNVELSTGSGTTTGNKEFGIITDSTVTTDRGSYILLTVITVSRGGNDNPFDVELAGIITAKNYHGDHIFHVYTGDGANVGAEWGTVRVSYQARSPYSELSTLAQGYVSYNQRGGSSTTITVKMYPIATFN